MSSAYKLISQNELKKFLYYNPETGIFKWIAKSSRGTKIGAVAGCYSEGYNLIQFKGKLLQAANLAWIYVNGVVPEGYEVDHIDKNPSNNSWNNLRIGTHRENSFNRNNSRTLKRKLPKWVYPSGNKFRARVNLNGKLINLGVFEEVEDAYRCAYEYAKKLHGDFFNNEVVL